jgi:molybdenum cofactor cytidylyltransferase
MTQGPAAADIPGIVLAAGQSTRLGSNKLLFPLRSKPVLHWVLDALLAAGLKKVIVVLGHESREVRQSCECFGEAVAYTENPAYVAGRATSIQVGLAAVGPAALGVLITPGDVPFIGGRLLPQLLAAFFSSSRITFPAVNGRKGHPVLFPASAFPLLMGLSGDETLHDYFREHPEATNVLPWHDEGCLLDIDSRSDIVRAESYCAGLDAGT